ncbi:MAG: DUF3325 family protein [Luteitalea sp.]|nr:DUF3325 family protein [Luteitalea sp.]
MTHATTFILCLVGFASLAVAMERHQKGLFGRILEARATRWTRTAGWLILLSALVVVVKGQGWSIGLVSYSGHTSAGAGLVFVALAVHGWLRPKRRA